MSEEEKKQSTENQPNTSQQQPTEPPKKHRWWIWVIVILVIVIIGGIWWWHSQQAAVNSTTESTVTSTSTSNAPEEVNEKVTVNIQSPKEAVDYVKQKYDNEQWKWQVKEEKVNQKDPTVAKHGTSYHVIAVKKTSQSTDDSQTPVIQKSVHVYSDGTIKEDTTETTHQSSN